jgi:type I restriction enzyme R subunit
MSQFHFLQPEFPDVYTHAHRAETLALSDPRGACFYTRLALETLVNWLYDHDNTLIDPYERTLNARLHEPTFKKLVGTGLFQKAMLIKSLGNKACHDSVGLTTKRAEDATRELFHWSFWLVRTYARGETGSGLIV